MRSDMRALLAVPGSDEAPAQSFRLHVAGCSGPCRVTHLLTSHRGFCTASSCATYSMYGPNGRHTLANAAARPRPRLEENKALAVHVSSYDAGLSHDRPLAEHEPAEPHIPEPSPPAHLGFPCARFINRMQLHWTTELRGPLIQRARSFQQQSRTLRITAFA